MKNLKKTIAIETSGQIGSVAVGVGEEILGQVEFSGVMKHTTELLPAIDKLCGDVGWEPKEIEQIFVSAGPGSFTGLRLAITTAKTLAYAVNCRIIAVPSIEAQVLNAEMAIADGIDVQNVAVVLEAGRGNVFGGIYAKDAQGGSFIPGYKTVVEPSMLSVADLLKAAAKPLYVLGLGIKYHKDEFDGDDVILLDEKYWSPRVEYIYRCGLLRAAAGEFVAEDAFEDAVKFEPVYMRRPEAEVKWEELGR